LKNSNEQIESLRVKIKTQVNKGNLMVGVYDWPPNQREDVGKTFVRQLQS